MLKMRKIIIVVLINQCFRTRRNAVRSPDWGSHDRPCVVLHLDQNAEDHSETNHDVSHTSNGAAETQVHLPGDEITQVTWSRVLLELASFYGIPFVLNTVQPKEKETEVPILVGRLNLLAPETRL